MTRNAAACLMIVAIVPLGIAGDDPAKDEGKKLQGTWHLVASDVNGIQVTGYDEVHAKLVFTGDNLAQWAEPGEDDKLKKVAEGKFRLNPAGKPKELDFAPDGEKGPARLFIYELAGDKLRVGQSTAKGGGRLKSWKSGKDVVIFEYERAKE